jgi:hypothetical protein
VLVGIFVGGYVAFDGEGGKPHQPPAAPVAEAVPVPVAAAAPAVAAPAVVEDPAPVAVVEPAVPVGRPQLVDVRIDSHPMGATVMIVDRGKTSFLGTTPLATSIDGARTYDLVFTLGKSPAQLVHFDPAQDKHLDTALVIPAPVAPEHHVAAPVAHRVAAPVADVAGEGTLMISSKPPCEILVDGKSTGLTTPQRSISLPSGKHAITLVSAADAQLKRTVAIEITPNKATKVIQDLMK